MLQRTDAGRRTGNQAFTAMPNGPLSGEIHRIGVELKILAQKAGSAHEGLVIMGNNLLALVELAEGLEGATLHHLGGE
jgi:hypothetical protein